MAKKIEKATETLMLSRALSKYRLQDIASIEAAYKKRKESSSKVVQKYSEIRVYYTCIQIQVEEEDEKKVVNICLKKKGKVQYKNYLKVLKELKESFIEII